MKLHHPAPFGVLAAQKEEKFGLIVPYILIRQRFSGQRIRNDPVQFLPGGRAVKRTVGRVVRRAAAILGEIIEPVGERRTE